MYLIFEEPLIVAFQLLSDDQIKVGANLMLQRKCRSSAHMFSSKK